MTHLLTWLPSWIFLIKASQLRLPHFIGKRLLQQVGCSVVPGWPAQHLCMSGVYSPIYSSSKWQWESFSTRVSHHSQVNKYSFVYKQLNDEIVLFQTIQFSISHLFALSLNFKDFYLTLREDTIRCCYSGPEWTRE